jgi:O-antigen ligase
VAVSEKGKLRLLALVSCAAQFTALLLTYSRGSWLGGLTSLLFFGITVKRKEVSVLMIASGLVLIIATPLRDRVFSLIRPQTDISINQRMLAMEAGVKLGLEHPLLGVGYGRGRLREGLSELYGGTETEVLQMPHKIAHTHNLYIEFFAETGVLGLASLLWLLGHALRQTLANASRMKGANRTLEFGIATSWIAFVVTGVGDVPFFHHDVRILFFTLLALVHTPREDPMSS